MHHTPRLRAPAHLIFPYLALHHISEHALDNGVILRGEQVLKDIHVEQCRVCVTGHVFSAPIDLKNIARRVEKHDHVVG